MKQGDIIEAPLSVSKGQKLGFVRNQDTEESVTIPFDKLLQALPGDTVAVEITGKQINGDAEGFVKEIVERKQTKFVGTVDKVKYCYVKPDNSRLHVDFLLDETDCANVAHNDKVFVEMTGWDEKKKNPNVKLLEKIGQKGIHEVEMRAIVLEKGFDADFPDEILKEAEDLKNKWHNIPAEEITKRRDMRGTTTFTIDPADAKDFDDALSFKKLENGNYEIGIHIADVSHYVTPGTALDAEAFERSNSVYLVDRTIPMLPEILSNDLCSLNPHEEKLAYSAIFELTPNAEVVNEWFGKTVIESDHRFTYESAQKVLDGRAEEHKEVLTIMNEIALKLEKKKLANGAIKFHSEEFEFELDPEGVPLRVVKKQHIQTHSLIENYMLLANKHVAKFTHDACKKKTGNVCELMYRVHQNPDPKKIEELAEFVKVLGYKLELQDDGNVSPKQLNALLDSVQGEPEEQLISTAAIRTMSKAMYNVQNEGHFGLAFPYYTHFTSPIRRYPDLIVHRIVEELTHDKAPSQRESQYFGRVATQASSQEVNAQSAERESIKFKQTEFMQNHIGEKFDGIISGVAKFGIFVVLDESGAEGMLHISKLGEDYWRHDEKHYRIVGEKTHKQFRLGDKIKVEIESVNIDERKLEMKLV